MTFIVDIYFSRVISGSGKGLALSQIIGINNGVVSSLSLNLREGNNHRVIMYTIETKAICCSHFG
jgi:hypothetical protein